MSEPYTPHLISLALRTMPIEALRTVGPRQFQTWPTRKIVKAQVIRELITNELARRRVQ